MSATAGWNAAVCGGLAAALLDACGGEPDTAAEWVTGAYAPSWGEVASALDDLRAAREHLSALIVAATPCEGCGSAAGIGCAFDCDPDAGACEGCDGCDGCLMPNCDTCGTPYDPGSREGRCGDCGECAEHCDHDANAWRCSCLCGCDSWLPALRQQTCDTCHDRCVGSGAFPAPGVTA